MMQKSTTILMAEDDEGHAVLIKRALKKAGLENEILRFADGQELLDFFEQEGDSSGPKDCEGMVLLLDIRMPKVDGIGVLDLIKGSERLKKLPVIMLTTTNSPEEIERCYQLGCNSYMVKPVQSAQFSECIRSLGDFLQKSEFPAPRNSKLNT